MMQTAKCSCRAKANASAAPNVVRPVAKPSASMLVRAITDSEAMLLCTGCSVRGLIKCVCVLPFSSWRKLR